MRNIKTYEGFLDGIFGKKEKEVEKIPEREVEKTSEEKYKELLLKIKPSSPSGDPIFNIGKFKQCKKELEEIGKWKEFLNSIECSNLYNKCVEEIRDNYGKDNAYAAYCYIEQMGKIDEFERSEAGKTYKAKAESRGKTNRGDYLNHGPYGFDPRDIENY